MAPAAHSARLNCTTSARMRRLVATLAGAAVLGLSLLGLSLVCVPVLAAEPAQQAKPTEPVPEPQDYRMDDFRSPVPATLKGAKVLTADEAADLWNANGAVFLDVYPQAPKPKNLPAGTYWREPSHRSIEGARWLPNVGYGALPDSVAVYFKSTLERLTGGNRDAPIVFFCLKDCWMSWNAAKRALEMGYRNVMWFRDGTDGWQELGYPLVDVAKEPETAS